MSITQLEYEFRNRYNTSKRMEFEDWIWGLLRLVHDVELQSPRQTQGDGGIDLIDIATSTVYQIYAPDYPTEAKLLKKIDDSFHRAMQTAPNIRQWIFIHNSGSDDLPSSCLTLLNTLLESHQHVIPLPWGPADLWRTIREANPRSLAMRIHGADDDLEDAATPESLSLFIATDVETWLPANHSSARVALIPSDDREAHAVGTYVKDLTGESVKHVDEVVTSGSSFNYRLVTSERPVLFRVEYRMNDSDAVAELDYLSQYISQSLGTRFPAMNHLVPISREPQRQYLSPTGRPPSLSHAAVYPYFEHRRFVPNHLEDIDQAGWLFGALLATLRELKPSHVKKITEIRSDLRAMEDLESLWGDAVKLAGMRVLVESRIEHAPFEMIANNPSLADGLGPAGESSEDPVVTYADLHPHNVLRGDDGQLMVCDLESCVEARTQEAGLAFATHRLCREYALRSGGNPLSEYATAARRFVKAARGSLPSDDELTAMGRAIRIANLTKALAVFDEFHLALNNVRSRKLGTEQCIELRKLMRYAAEGSAIEQQML